MKLAVFGSACVVALLVLYKQRRSIPCWFKKHEDRFVFSGNVIRGECTRCWRVTRGWDLTTQKPEQVQP